MYSREFLESLRPDPALFDPDCEEESNQDASNTHRIESLALKEIIIPTNTAPKYMPIRISEIVKNLTNTACLARVKSPVPKDVIVVKLK